MTDMNKEAISVLNDLIETSKDGQEGFKTCAEDIKHPELKTLFVQRSADCAAAVAQSAERVTNRVLSSGCLMSSAQVLNPS